MNRVLKIFRIINLLIRKHDIQKRLKKLSKTSFSDGMSKVAVAEGTDVTINTKKKEKIAEVKSNITAIVKNINGNPEKLLDYVKATNTPVYRIKYANKFLNYISEEEGFIGEKRGFDALYLSFITGIGASLSTPPMFILSPGNVDKYYLIHHFYRWYSMKANLPGFDYKTQKRLKKYLRTNSKTIQNDLSLEEIAGLQEGIARDNEATDFVLAYEKETAVAKKIADKIKNDGGANI